MDKIVPSIVFNMEVREQDRQSIPYEILSNYKNLIFILFFFIKYDNNIIITR
jgi:hypothetical protein